MKNITITLDLKSLCIGALGVFAIMSLSNFNNANERRDDPTDEVRRYQAVADERGYIILDTKTGKYIIDRYVGRPNWLRGDFTTKHSDSATKKD